MPGFCEVNQWIPNKSERSDAKSPHHLLHESGHHCEDIWAIGTGLMSAGFLYKISLEPLMVSTMLQFQEDFFDLGQVLINRNTQVRFKYY